jgi:hypothetical protein
MANQNNGAFVLALRSAAYSLSQTDRDYEGHRARALHQVIQAMRHLMPSSMRGSLPNNSAVASSKRSQAGAGAAAKAGAGKKDPMKQEASDAHLRDALSTLTSVQSHLANQVGTPSHVRASSSIQGAIQELNQALAAR